MNNDLVTVIVAAYNHENYIEEGLNALIAQTYQNIELVLIDDGSKDKTFEKVLAMKPQLEKRFVNVHIEKQKNMGCANTVKKLVSLANGKYIFSIASDDVAHNNAIEELYTFLQQNDEYVCAVGDNDFIDSNSKKINMDEEKQPVSKKSYYSYRTFLEYAYVRYQILFGKHLTGMNKMEDMDYIPYYLLWCDHVVPIGLLIKTDVMKQVTNYNVNCPIDDMYLHFQLTKIGKEKVLPIPLVKYRLHRTQTINSSSLLDKAKCTRFYELYLLDTKYPQFKSKKLENSWWYMTHKKEWDKSKNSPLWDEQYYVNKYPEIVEAGWIPLVHYLTEGKEKGFLPSKYFEHPLHRVRKGCNMLCRKKKNIIKRLKFKQRFKIASYGILLVLAQIPLLDVLLSRKVRNILGKKISKYWR